MVTLRERRRPWSSLGLSLALHAAAFAALVPALGARPVDPGPEPPGMGLVLVELVAAPHIDRPAALAAAPPPAVRRAPAAAPPPAVRRAPAAAPPLAVRPARETAIARPRAAGPRVAPEPPRIALEPPRAPEPEPATARVDPGSGIAPDPAPASEGAETGVAPAHADGGAFAGGRLSRVARPASEIVPRYPDLARERGDEAEVIVEAWVAASGRVERARIRSSAGSEFDVAALEAVRAARFHPAWRDGAPVESLVAMRLHFELER